jgi:hypothetical protein
MTCYSRIATSSSGERAEDNLSNEDTQQWSVIDLGMQMRRLTNLPKTYVTTFVTLNVMATNLRIHGHVANQQFIKKSISIPENQVGLL